MSQSSLPIDNFDSAVRPQDDLYRHVNGRWLETAVIPDDKPITGAFHDLRDNSERTLGDILDELSAGHHEEGSEEWQLATLYASFMDEAAIESLDSQPLEVLLAHVDAIETVPDLLHHFGWGIRHGLGGLFGAGGDADPGDPARYVLFVAQDGLGLPDEEYYRLEQHAKILAAYRDHVERTLTLAGLPDPRGQAAAVVELETEIAARHWDKVRTRDLQQMYNLQTVAEFMAQAPGLWEGLREGAGIPEGEVTEFVNCQPSFFTSVLELLVPQRLDAWRSWARFHLISGVSPYLSSRFVDERFDFYERTLSGTPKIRERWKRGVGLVERVMGEVIGKQYVARRFSPTAKQRMDELVARLVEAYRNSITALDWMSADTKAEALTKLANFRPKIGYPTKWRDYSLLRVVPNDLVTNVLTSASFEFDHMLSKLANPMDPEEWLMFPQTVNAYYHPLRNEIVFPAAILQPPFFSETADDAVNYGGIGAVIGHEIGHGFDDQGSRCDGEGRLRDWWTAADRDAFENRTRSLIDQYSALSPAQAPGQHVNGELTIGENIGDLGGLSIAYQAWQLATEGQELAEIDGLTPQQRFFYSWAAVWATKSRDELVLQRLATDPHSPPEFRCNQIVRNVPAFYEAFAVAKTDQAWLPPAERVKIW